MEAQCDVVAMTKPERIIRARLAYDTRAAYARIRLIRQQAAKEAPAREIRQEWTSKVDARARMCQDIDG